MLAVAANPMAHANVYLREHFDPAVPGNASDPSRIPVIIAAADLRQKGVKLEETKEPLELILDAVELAIGRSGASDRSAVLKSIDAVACVATWSWPYLDLPASIARRLGKDPDALKRREYTKHAGNQPIRLLDDHAKLIAQGRIQCGLICAGEALKSLEEFRKAGKEPKWEPTTSSKTGAADKAGVEIKSPSARAQSEAMIKHGAYLAIHAYPLYENAVRAARGQKYKANLDESASLYSEFSSIATRIPSSWNYGETPKSAADILEGPTNRMISTPYPLLQNAFNTVNLASAILVCSLSLARDLGIPESKLVYPLGGAGTQDPVDLLARSSFTASPALTTTLSIALSQSRLAPTDIDAWDIYSCFPIVPKLAAMHLGMPVLAPQRKKPVSIIGGLTSFGGAGNSYSMHAVVRMVEGLQKGEWKSGVVLGNGGFLTYQHAIVLSSTASAHPYPTDSPLPETLPQPGCPTLIETIPSGSPLPAKVETYTVVYGKAGPLKAALVLRLASGERTVANAETAVVLAMHGRGEEVVGKNGKVVGKGNGVNWFVFDGEASKL